MINGNFFIQIIFAFFSVMIAVILHEVMHGYVAFWLGDDTAKNSNRLTLNPFAHIDIFTTILLPIILYLLHLPAFGAAKPVPINTTKLKYDEFGAALVAAAGPVTNFVLAILGGVILHYSFNLGYVWINWWNTFIAINIGFFIFNMIPFPPLDGSRILYAFAPSILQKTMEHIERFGILAVLLFMLVFFQFLSPSLQEINQILINFVIRV